MSGISRRCQYGGVVEQRTRGPFYTVLTGHRGTARRGSSFSIGIDRTARSPYNERMRHRPLARWKEPRFLERGSGLGGLNRTPKARRGVRLYIGRGLSTLRALQGRKFADVVVPGGYPTSGRLGTLGYALNWWAKLTGEVSQRTVVALVMRLRARQIPAGLVGQTVSDVTGVFEGARERTVLTDILYFQSNDEPTFKVFEENIGALAEHVAYALAQKTVIIEIFEGARTDTLEASPTGFPAPEDSDELDRFIAEAKKR